MSKNIRVNRCGVCWYSRLYNDKYSECRHTDNYGEQVNPDTIDPDCPLLGLPDVEQTDKEKLSFVNALRIYGRKTEQEANVLWNEYKLSQTLIIPDE